MLWAEEKERVRNSVIRLIHEGNHNPWKLEGVHRKRDNWEGTAINGAFFFLSKILFTVF